MLIHEDIGAGEVLRKDGTLADDESKQSLKTLLQ